MNFLVAYCPDCGGAVDGVRESSKRGAKEAAAMRAAGYRVESQKTCAITFHKSGCTWSQQ